MIGILAEKNSAARNFAKALGAKENRVQHIWTGSFQGEDFLITAAAGHLYEFAKPDAQVSQDLYAKYHSWNVANLPWDETDFAWKSEPGKDNKTLLKQIKAALSRCSEIVIGTDVDPSGEGELIAWEIIDNLNLRPLKVSRMYHIDESVKEVQKAFQNRKVLPPMMQDGDYRKAVYRSKWDFLSMQFTRLATAYAGGGKVLRQGRLKSAMVVLTGDQLKAIADYKPIPSYQNRFRDENGVMYTDPKEPIYPKKEQVPQTYHASAVVVDSKTVKHTAPPKLITLDKLSAQLSKKGYKAKDVLAVYQKMYEAQRVSYPRTEDKVISPEQFKEMLNLMPKIAALVGVDVRLLTYTVPRNTHVKTGGSHGANRPGPNVPNSLSELSQYGTCAVEIYEILAKSTLAMFCEDYEYESQKGHIQDYPFFVGTASVPLKAGWKAVLGDTDKKEDDNGKGLGTIGTPMVYEIIPPKPATPTMEWLMTQLEKRDVGTGATRTSTYADVTNDKNGMALMKDTRGKISFTEAGERSYLVLPGTYIGDLGITEQVYADMRSIADGTAQESVLLYKVRDLVTHDRDVMMRNAANLPSQYQSVQKGSQSMEQKEKMNGIWNGKPVSCNRVFRGYRFTDQEVEDLMNGNTIVVHNLKAKSGNTYSVNVKLDYYEFNGKKYVGAVSAGFADDGGSGRKKGIPKSWCQHVFTEDERILLENGQTIYITGCISKKTGNSFDCSIRWDKTEERLVPEF